jgi:hypothetical protein
VDVDAADTKIVNFVHGESYLRLPIFCKHMVPTIRIQSSALLNDFFELPAYGDLKKHILNYQKEWQKWNEKILTTLQGVTGLTFAQKFIDVYVIDSKSKRAISDPLILATSLSNKEFAFYLSHELTHRLTSDNTTRVNWHMRAQSIYSKEDVLVANHIMIHAVLEAVYTRIGKKEEIEADIVSCQKLTAYKKAWEIVRRDGYQIIIEKLRQAT